MPSDFLNMDDIDAARAESITASIQPITVEALRALGEGLFPYADHPWREKFFTFLNENSGATFYHATTSDRIHIIYCPAQDKGMWFMPGSGMGPLQKKGLTLLKELTGGKK